MAHDIQLAYGVRDGQILHVSQVDRGLACGVQCMFCAAPLVARKGNVRKAHFSHLAAECAWSPESILHRVAKEALRSICELCLPGETVTETAYDLEMSSHKASKVALEPATVRIRDVVLEQYLDDVRPDALVVSERGRRLAVEIAVTHHVDRRKQEKLQAAALPTVEIRLEPRDAELSMPELAKLIAGGTRTFWVYHPRLAVARASLRADLAQRIQERNRAIQMGRVSTARAYAARRLRRARMSTHHDADSFPQRAFDRWMFSFQAKRGRVPTEAEVRAFLARRT